MAEEILLTKEGYAAKQAELDELRTVKRPEIAEQIKVAREYGDISENAEYDAAKNEQAELEYRIRELESLLKNATVIEKDKKKDIVRIGKKVEIRKVGVSGASTEAFTIVSSSEADPIKRRISNVSPVGAALLDKKVKDRVDVKLPDGTVTYEIVSIE